MSAFSLRRRAGLAPFSSLVAVLLAACASAPPASRAPSAPAPAPLAAAPPIAPPSAGSLWGTIDIGKTRVGRTHDVVTPLAGGLVQTQTTSEIKLRQLDAPLSLSVELSKTEDERGALRASRAVIHSATISTTVDVTIDGLTATVKQTTGGVETVRTLVLKEAVVGPEEVRRRLVARLHAPGDRVDVPVWSDQLSAPSAAHSVVEAAESLDIDGVGTPVLRVKSNVEGETEPNVAWLDHDGRPLRSEEQVSFGKVTVTRVSRAPEPITEAPSIDTLTETVIRSNARLPDARSTDRLVVRITPIDAATSLPSFEGPGQTVLSRDAAGVVLAIERLPPPAPHATVGAGAEDAALLAPSGVIDPRDPGVRAVASEVTANETDPWRKAQALARWVATHMTYDPKVPGAPASVLVKDLHGTCAAYATLLTSLLRAADIPARQVAGLLYTGGVFGGHAWTEARIGGRWVSLDATTGNVGTADAARIAIAHDTTEAGGNIPTMQVLGHVKVAVLEYAPHGGHAVKVDAGAAPYVVEGATYRNTGLGLSITLPKGATYADLDAVWPNPSFVTANIGDQKVVVQEVDVPQVVPFEKQEAALLQIPSLAACKPLVVAGRRGCRVVAPWGEMVAWSRGSSLLVVGAIGDKATETLSEVAKTVRFREN